MISDKNCDRHDRLGDEIINENEPPKYSMNVNIPHIIKLLNYQIIKAEGMKKQYSVYVRNRNFPRNSVKFNSLETLEDDIII